MPACALKKALTVTPEAQVMHLELVVRSFTDGGRRLRASARTKLRLSQEQFDRYSDFACIYSACLAEARQLTSWTADKEAEVMKIFFQKFLGLIFCFFVFVVSRLIFNLT